MASSVVVRTLNSGAKLEQCLRSLDRQTVRPEIIVVDSGSTDDTLEISARYADRIERIARNRFSYGGALNVGASAAVGTVCFALSSHCEAPPNWVATALRHYERSEVAGTNGQLVRPNGDPLREPMDFTADTELPDPLWCFSNHASSWRMSVWRTVPFNEELTASEDADWSDRVVAAGYTIVFDPALTIGGTHRREGGIRKYYERNRREFLATASIRPVAAPTLLQTAERWAFDLPSEGKGYRQLLSPWRAAELLGRWSAGRAMRQARR